MNSIFFACVYYIIAIFLCLFIQLHFSKKKITEGLPDTDVTQYAKNDIVEYPILVESIKDEETKNKDLVQQNTNSDKILSQSIDLYEKNSKRLQVLQDTFNKLNSEKDRLTTDNSTKFTEIIDKRTELSKINQSHIY
jgi:hypothetical protein